MKVLVACEESQRVTIELRKLGNEAYSCDLLECSGNHPEWHIKKDVTLLLNGNCIFNTVDGVEHEISGKWDMIIAFPPCTYLTVTGNRWFNYKKYGDKAIQRMLDRNDAIKFFMTIANADCDKIAIENPVGVMSTYWRKPDQIIQPYQYGDAYEKRTCLWLKGLPTLTPTKIVEIPDRIQFKSGKTMAKWYVEAGNLSKEQRALVRSKTFPGIARAMAEQWGNDCSNLKKVPKNSIYGMFGESQDTEHDRIKYLMDTHSLSPRVTMNGDCMKTVLNMEELLIQRYGNAIAHKCKMYNNGYYGCPADRQGNRCCGEKWCAETWKRYEAIINPEWHHVSLATLANIDFDMLDKKRQVYLKAHSELKRTLADLSKCKTGHTYEARARKFMRDMISQYYDNEISYAMRKYLDLQLSMSNVVNGVWSSYVEPATGLHESRRYSIPTLTY